MNVEYCENLNKIHTKENIKIEKNAAKMYEERFKMKNKN